MSNDHNTPLKKTYDEAIKTLPYSYYFNANINDALDEVKTVLKRFLLVVLGLVLLGIVIYLGLRATSEPAFVVWFGLAAAIFIPGSIAAIRYAFTAKERKMLQELARVPVIDKQIRRSKNLEEQIRQLEEEKVQIAEVTRLESRRQTLLERKKSLEEDGSRILYDLQAIDLEIRDLDVYIQSSPATQQVKELYERLQARRRGDVVIRWGSRYYRVDRDLILGLFPLGTGRLVLAYFRLLEEMLNWQRRPKDRD